MSEIHRYEFDVQMPCSGCSGAIERVLKRAKETGEGVDDFTVSLNPDLENDITGKVNVTGTIAYETLLTKIQKTGKTVLGGRTLEEEIDAVESTGPQETKV